MVRRIVLAIAVAVFIARAPAYAAVNPGDLCKEGKNKAAGKKTLDLLKAFGKNQKVPNVPKLAQDISKAQSHQGVQQGRHGGPMSLSWR